jgi:hypothetical protein
MAAMESITERTMMDGGGGIERTKSEQLAPTQSPLSRTGSGETVLSQPRKSSFAAAGRRPQRQRSASVGGGGNHNSHIRKSRSAQLKLDVEELVSSSAALSRASSASLGFSFTFTGFTPPPRDMVSAADAPHFSDDDES